MKTVAVMTMAFLPAACYAAIFAMPFFEFGGSYKPDKVIKNKHGFNLFLGLTLATTVAIFLVWAVPTYLRKMIGRYRISTSRPDLSEKENEE